MTNKQEAEFNRKVAELNSAKELERLRQTLCGDPKQYVIKH